MTIDFDPWKQFIQNGETVIGEAVITRQLSLKMKTEKHYHKERYTKYRDLLCDSDGSRFCNAVCDKNSDPIWKRESIPPRDLEFFDDAKIKIGHTKHKDICTACNMYLC